MPFTIRLLSTAASFVAAILFLAVTSISEPNVVSAQGGDPQPVRDVVEAFNYAMVDATAQRDPSLIRDYVTDEFYQEMVIEMRADWSAGLATVDLVELEWGSVQVRGTDATAYTVETWAVTGVDGSSGEFPPEINLYRLVLENGSWKVDANDHPNSMF